MLVPCCAWAAPWSIFIANPSSEFPNGSRSTSTTHSTRSMAGSSCDCSMRITTNTAFSRSSCSMARAASTPPVLRPAKRPGGKEVRAFLRPPVARNPRQLAEAEILLRADSHYCSPEVLDWCRANGLDYILGVAPTTTLRRHIGDLEASTKARFEAAPKEGKARRFKEFFDGAASWSRVERIVARVEAGADGAYASLSPLSRVWLVYFTRMSTVGAARRKTTSSPGRRIWRPTAPRAPKPRPTSSEAVPARRRLLAHVGPARIDAQTFDVARRAVRHVAPAARQVAARVVEMKTMIGFTCRRRAPPRMFATFVLGRPSM